MRDSVHWMLIFNLVLFTFLGSSILLLPACSSQGFVKPPLQIEGMSIENQTQMWVSAVRLLVPVTGNFVSCGNISPRSRCSTTFPEAGYTGNPVEITWSQGGQIHSTGQFVIQLPDDLDYDKPAMVRIVIAGPGSAGAAIVQIPD
jgi:hypothetical protein